MTLGAARHYGSSLLPSAGFVVTLWSLVAAARGPAAGPEQAGRHEAATPLCAVLETISPGEQRPATVRGVLVIGFEHVVLYDPATPLCALDVQPTTEVEFVPGAPGSARLQKITKANGGRAYVILKGLLWGPGELGKENVAEHPIVDYARRRPERYGHLSYSRTKFVVSNVLDSEPVPTDEPSLGDLSAGRPDSAFPILLEAALPIYPGLARRAGISGDVVVDVTVISGRVAATTVQAGDRILSRAVLDNIATWRFKDDVEATFTTRYTFTLELRKTGADRNTRLELNLPSTARLIAAQEAW